MGESYVSLHPVGLCAGGSARPLRGTPETALQLPDWTHGLVQFWESGATVIWHETLLRVSKTVSNKKSPVHFASGLR